MMMSTISWIITIQENSKQGMVWSEWRWSMAIIWIEEKKIFQDTLVMIHLECKYIHTYKYRVRDE